MLTAKGEDMDKILGLGGGADDCDQAVQYSRGQGAHQDDSAPHDRTTQNLQRVVLVRDLKLNMNNRSVSVGGREVNLTAKEFDLLQMFVTNRVESFLSRKPAGNNLEIRLSGRFAHCRRAYPPPAKD